MEPLIIPIEAVLVGDVANSTGRSLKLKFEPVPTVMTEDGPARSLPPVEMIAFEPPDKTQELTTVPTLLMLNNWLGEVKLAGEEPAPPFISVVH